MPVNPRHSSPLRALPRYLLPLCILSCGVLTSCAPTLGHGPIDWEHGARRARVLALSTPEAGAAAAHACGAQAPPDAHYVQVRYRHARLYRNVVALLPADLAARPGDEVELRPGDCDEGRLARVERVLPPPREHE